MSFEPSVKINEHTPVTNQPEINSVKDRNEIDVGEVALKVLSSMALTVTNTILTITVGAMKLTGFTVLTSLVLGHLTRPLHACNKALAKHAFAPFKEWSEVLGKENERIIETEKVFKFSNKKLFFSTENYKKHALDSLKAITAPISLALSVTNATLWLAVKPGWLAYVPGLLGDALVTGPIALNKAIGHITYSPLKNISDWMYDKHLDHMKLEWMGKICPGCA